MAFSREDAVVIAYASFGKCADRFPIGVAAVVTCDGGMATNFKLQYSNINTRFERMILNLPAPYTDLKLPLIMTAAAVLAAT